MHLLTTGWPWSRAFTFSPGLHFLISNSKGDYTITCLVEVLLWNPAGLLAFIQHHRAILSPYSRVLGPSQCFSIGPCMPATSEFRGDYLKMCTPGHHHRYTEIRIIGASAWYHTPSVCISNLNVPTWASWQNAGSILVHLGLGQDVCVYFVPGWYWCCRFPDHILKGKTVDDKYAHIWELLLLVHIISSPF